MTTARKIFVLSLSVGFILFGIFWWLDNPTRTILEWSIPAGIHFDDVECGPRAAMSRSRNFQCFGHGRAAIENLKPSMKKKDWNRETLQVVFHHHTETSVCRSFLVPLKLASEKLMGNLDAGPEMVPSETKNFEVYFVEGPSNFMAGFIKPILIVNPADFSFCLITGFAYS